MGASVGSCVKHQPLFMLSRFLVCWVTTMLAIEGKWETEPCVRGDWKSWRFPSCLALWLGWVVYRKSSPDSNIPRSTRYISALTCLSDVLQVSDSFGPWGGSVQQDSLVRCILFPSEMPLIFGLLPWSEHGLWIELRFICVPVTSITC